MFGTLYLVATPIGNLSDISERALKTLREADLIACEDTRHTRKLLNFYEIANRLVSYHEHNEAARAAEFARSLTDGKNIALVSDAGTPGICDPGFRLVQTAIAMGAQVVSIPGAAAFVSALVVSGLPTDSFFFGGFLPSKKAERQRRLREVENIPATLVFYESPHRLQKSLADCVEILGRRRAVVARELTKLHEEIVRGKLDELAKIFAERAVKGEIVVVIDRQRVQSPESEVQSQKSVFERVAELQAEGFDRKIALKKAAKEFGIPRSEAYRSLVNQNEKSKV